MELRAKGGIEVMNLGFGAWAIGGQDYGTVRKEDAFDALDCYFENGGNFIDTAQGYGFSEQLIGEYLLERNAQPIIATKTHAGSDMESLDEIETRLDQSLKKLKRDYVDIYYLHSPSSEVEVIEKSLEIMNDLKSKGKILAVGASIKGVDVTNDTVELSRTYIDTDKVDVIQMVYSILRQKNSNIFQYAYDHNVAIVTRTSLESGFLTGKYGVNTVFDSTDHRCRWNGRIEDIMMEVETLQGRMLENQWDNNLISLALRFARNPKNITSTIIGAKNRTQMQHLLDSFNKPNLSEPVIAELVESYRNQNERFNTRE